MLDLKNNSENRMGDGKDRHLRDDGGLQAFDRQLRQRLEGAEVQPDPGIMDKIFEQMAAEVDESITGQVLTGHRKSLSKKAKRLFFVTAAAAAMVAIVVGMSWWWRTQQPTPGQQVAGQLQPVNLADQMPGAEMAAGGGNEQSGQSSIQEPLAELPQADAKDKSIKETKRTIAKADVSSPEPEQEVPHAAPVATGAAEEPRIAATPAAENNAVAVAGKQQDTRPQEVVVVPIETKTALDSDVSEHTSGQAVVKEEQRTAVALQSGESQEVLQHPDTRGALVEMSGTNDRVEAASHQTASADPPARRRRRGLFRGLVQNLGNTARTLSSQLVEKDEEKTVINVGFLAITTYK